jgi:phosphoribosylformylglycinamidine (FGAM) synthase-like amidotransferase family enzyme
VFVKAVNTDNKFCNKYRKNQILKLNIAHNEGNYFTNAEHLKELEERNLIAFKYCSEDGVVNEENNPNGSLNNIAGIFNEKKNILGMMPHPERMVDPIITNDNGVNLFTSLLN